MIAAIEKGNDRITTTSLRELPGPAIRHATTGSLIDCRELRSRVLLPVRELELRRRITVAGRH